MITRRDFLKTSGVGLGSIALPSWFVLPEPATDIQKYFSFINPDGRILLQVQSYDAYEIISYIYCSIGERPSGIPFGKSKHRFHRDRLKYYYARAEISGMFLYHQAGIEEPGFNDGTLEAFQKDIKESRDELEALIKKELGTRNIWVFDNKSPHDMKFLKRI